MSACCRCGGAGMVLCDCYWCDLIGLSVDVACLTCEGTGVEKPAEVLTVERKGDDCG